MVAPSDDGLVAAKLTRSKKIEIIATSDSWVEIKDTAGVLIMRKVLRPGDKYKVPEESDLVLSTGNAGGLTVIIGGKKVRVLGRNAEVQRNIPLSEESFVSE